MTCKTEISQQMQQELNKTSKLVYKILMIVGAVGLLSYILIDIEAWWTELLLVFSIPFGVGLVLLLTVKKLEKQVVWFKQFNVYQFDNEFLLVETFKNQESISKSKIYYKDLVKIKQTVNYIFLYINRTSALPILKETLAINEQQELLNKINIQKKRAI